MRSEAEIHDMEGFFQHQTKDNRRFWVRLGGRPDVQGLDALEIGCGHGSLSFDLAAAGARSVLGIDISEERIAFANAKAAANPDWEATVRFLAQPIQALPGEDRFDLVVSKDTFEHIVAIEDTVRHLARLLRPGGRALIGFSPLYHSPFGDHGELGARLPWQHLVAGEAAVVAAFNRTNLTTHRSLHEAGFNAYTADVFLDAFAEAGLTVERVRVNPDGDDDGWPKRLVMAAFKIGRRLPGLDRYLTVGLYCCVRKPAGANAGRPIG